MGDIYSKTVFFFSHIRSVYYGIHECALDEKEKENIQTVSMDNTTGSSVTTVTDNYYNNFQSFEIIIILIHPAMFHRGFSPFYLNALTRDNVIDSKSIVRVNTERIINGRVKRRLLRERVCMDLNNTTHLTRHTERPIMKYIIIRTKTL